MLATPTSFVSKSTARLVDRPPTLEVPHFAGPERTMRHDGARADYRMSSTNVGHG
jgi:hypothetical protein